MRQELGDMVVRGFLITDSSTLMIIAGTNSRESSHVVQRVVSMDLTCGSVGVWIMDYFGYVVTLYIKSSIYAVEYCFRTPSQCVLRCIASKMEVCSPHCDLIECTVGLVCVTSQ